MRRSSPSYSDGFSIIEMMLALTLALVVIAGAASVGVSSRRVSELDSARTDLNQNLRIALDYLEADIRQAGERLGNDIPALLIDDGPGGTPDRLVVRRNLIPTVLRVCSDTSGTTEDIAIAQLVTPPQGCAPVPDDDADGWPENLEAWKDYRAANGPTVRAFIYNPVTRNGEFFDYVAEDAAAYTISAASGVNWLFNYPVADNCRIYVLEERSYNLSGDMLQIVINEDAANPLMLVDRLTDFQTAAVFKDFSEQTALAATDSWSQLRSIRVTMRGEVAVRDVTIERTTSNEVVPRNVIAR